LRKIAVLIVLVAIGLAAPATAQERVLLPTLPDLDLARLIAPGFHGENDLYFDVAATPSTWLDLGPGSDTSGKYGVTGVAGVGWRLDDVTMVAARGEATGIGDYDGANPSESLRGWHRLEARTGFGDPGRDDMGIDLSLRYEALHSGKDGWALAPSDWAWGHNVSDERIEVGVWPRGGDDDDLIGLLPIRYKLRNVSYPRGGGPVGGFTTHEVSSGIGIRAYDDEFVSGWWEFVGVSYSRTEFAPPQPGHGKLTLALRTDGPDLPEFERIDLRVLNIDQVVLAESDFIIGMNYRLGASWLWKPQQEYGYSIFTGGLGVRARFEDGEFGLGMSREALATPDGRRFTEAFRFEGMLEVVPEDSGIGAGIRGGFHQFGNDEKGPKPVRSGAIHSRWFLAPIEGAKIGAYHLATHGPRVDGGAFDPIHYDQNWAHELGLFLELNDQI
jgi:hypothetical protein